MEPSKRDILRANEIIIPNTGPRESVFLRIYMIIFLSILDSRSIRYQTIIWVLTAFLKIRMMINPIIIRIFKKAVKKKQFNKTKVKYMKFSGKVLL